MWRRSSQTWNSGSKNLFFRYGSAYPGTAARSRTTPYPAPTGRPRLPP